MVLAVDARDNNHVRDLTEIAFTLTSTETSGPGLGSGRRRGRELTWPAILTQTSWGTRTPGALSMAARRVRPTVRSRWVEVSRRFHVGYAAPLPLPIRLAELRRWPWPSRCRSCSPVRGPLWVIVHPTAPSTMGSSLETESCSEGSRSAKRREVGPKNSGLWPAGRSLRPALVRSAG